MESYISKKARKGEKSPIHGRGLFAIEEIKKGEVVSVKGGAILTRAQLNSVSVQCHAETQIADDLFIAPTNEEEYGKSMMCVNHSCNPNVGMRGDIVVVAMRDICAGEELTLDYAMIDHHASAFACHCGTPHCRKQITGYDWRKKELQEKYKGYFSAYIQTLMR